MGILDLSKVKVFMRKINSNSPIQNSLFNNSTMDKSASSQNYPIDKFPSFSSDTFTSDHSAKHLKEKRKTDQLNKLLKTFLITAELISPLPARAYSAEPVKNPVENSIVIDDAKKNTSINSSINSLIDTGYKQFPNDNNPEFQKPNGIFSDLIEQGTTVYEYKDNNAVKVYDGTGDCWLIARILSLKETEKGRELLDKIINVNDDGSVTVNFLGSKDKYTISAEELQNRQVGYERLSQGDPDYLAVEKAINQHLLKKCIYGEENRDNPINDVSKLNSDILDISKELFGVEMKSKLKKIRPFEYSYIDELKQQIDSGAIIGAYVALMKGHPTISFEEKRQGNKKLISNHAYAITKINSVDKTVTVINPHKGDKPIKLSYDELIGFFNQIDTIKAQ